MQALEKVEHYSLKTDSALRDSHGRQIWWGVLPYPPGWFSAINAAVQAFNADVAAKALYENVMGKMSPIVRISWRNYLPSIAGLMKPRKRWLDGVHSGG